MKSELFLKPAKIGVEEPESPIITVIIDSDYDNLIKETKKPKLKEADDKEETE